MTRHAWTAAMLCAASIGLAAAPREIEIKGMVTDARGQGVPGARVALVRVDEMPPAKAGDPPTHQLVQLDAVTTLLTGDFSLKGVANGKYQLTVVAGNDWLIADGLTIDGTPILKPIVLQLDGKTRVVSLGPVKDVRLAIPSSGPLPD